jgi:hypothetical protein
MNPSSASSFRRMACGMCLLIAPALILVASIIDPAAGEGDDRRKALAALKDDPDATEISTALYLVGFALMAIGIVGLVHVIRGRGVTLANIGGALAILGMIMFTALVTTALTNLNNVEHLEFDTAVALSEDLEEDYWSALVVFIPAIGGTVLGFILLGIAIIRSRVAHMAAAVLIILGALGIVVLSASKAGGIAVNALLLAGWGLVGLKLLGLKDEQWEGRAPIDAPAAGGPPAGGGPPAATPPPA